MNLHAHPTTPKPTCTHTLLLHMYTVLELTNSRAGHKCEAWENSFLPTSMTTLFRVRPWDLWIVTAHASLRGSWRREHWGPAVAKRNDGHSAVRESGARVAVKVDHDSNEQVCLTSCSVADGLNSSHCSIDKANIKQPIAGCW